MIITEFTKKLIKLEASMKVQDLHAALSVLDHNNDGLIDFSEFMALFDLDDQDLEQRNSDNEQIQWGDIEDIQKAKHCVLTIHDSLRSKIGNPEKAFSIFDSNNEGTISVNDFEKVLHTFGKDNLTEGNINILIQLA